VPASTPSTTSDVATVVTRSSRRRRRLRPVAYGLAFLLFPLPWFVATVGRSISGPDLGSHRVHDLTGAGVALCGVWLAGLLVSLVRPRYVAALQQVLVVIAALAIAEAITGEMYALPIILGVPVALVVLAQPDRRALFTKGQGLSPVLAPLALIAAIPLARYAADQGVLQHDAVVGDPHAKMSHYTDMAWVGVLIPLLGLLAAVRTAGWRIPAWSAGILATTFGLSSLAFHDASSALDRGWAVVAALGGIAFVALGEWEASRLARSTSQSGAVRHGRMARSVLVAATVAAIGVTAANWSDASANTGAPAMHEHHHHDAGTASADAP
jgi:hypothetical protein